MAIRGRIDELLQLQKEEEEQRLKSAFQDVAAPKTDQGSLAQPKTVGLSLKRPGIGKLLGSQNPLRDDDYDQLAEYFKLTKKPLM